MFTGIVEERGRVVSANGRLVVETAAAGDASLGESISVNGVCLTVAAREEGRLGFDLAEETLERTTLSAARPGDHVNVERPVTLLSRLGGHLVQGHVDGVATVHAIREAGEGREVTFSLPEPLRPYVVEKGSIAIDGVSLTVAALDEDSFTVALVPHTLEVTTLGELADGDEVNLEVDVLAKYVESLLGRRS